MDYSNVVEQPPIALCPNSENANFVMEHFLEVQKRNLDNIRDTGKFIVFSSTNEGGLGNRIPSLIGSFFLALVLNRGFLVHWPEVAETVNEEQERLAMVGFGDLFDPPVPIDIGAIPGFHALIDVETAFILKLDLEADMLLCADLEARLRDEQFVVVQGWRPFFDLLFHNKFLTHKLHSLGIMHLVHDLATCLLHPVPEIYEILQRFRADYKIQKHQKLIGVHIRKHSNHGLTRPEQEGLWSCIRKKHPPPALTPSNDQMQLWVEEGEDIPLGLPSPDLANSSSLYFLATDSDETLKYVPRDFRPYVIRLAGDATRHTQSGLMRALADMWILGNSYEVFGAQGTTFLNAVRVLFPAKVSLAVLAGNHVDKYCRSVGELPCYKWWDIFKSQDSANFSLSCFKGSAKGKNIIVC